MPTYWSRSDISLLPAERNAAALSRWALWGVLLASLLAHSACLSYAAPAKLTPQQSAMVSSARMPLKVEVALQPWPAEAERLAQLLHRTQLFEQVALEGVLAEPDLVAQVEMIASGTGAVMAFHTLLSLGLIPAVYRDGGGEIFSLRSAKTPDRQMNIDFTYSGTGCMGWLASLCSLRSDSTLSVPEDTDRYTLGLAHRLAEQRTQILTLAR